jgi:hypothetical protein
VNRPDKARGGCEIHKVETAYLYEGGDGKGKLISRTGKLRIYGQIQVSLFLYIGRTGVALRHGVIAVPRCGHARNRGSLAQGRIPFVLEADLQSQEARRETTDVEGGSGIDLPDGR